MARKFNGYGRGGAGMGGGMNMSAMIKKAQKMQEEMVKAPGGAGQQGIHRDRRRRRGDRRLSRAPTIWSASSWTRKQ